LARCRVDALLANANCSRPFVAPPIAGAGAARAYVDKLLDGNTALGTVIAVLVAVAGIVLLPTDVRHLQSTPSIRQALACATSAWWRKKQ